MKKFNLKIDYIDHSGFTVESENHFLVFDYYRGEINFPNKKTSVFVSHGHEDHYNPSIFDFKGDIDYIVSNDIGLDRDVHFVQPDSEIQVNDLNIKVFGSTDLGVSFLVTVDGVNIFHAGDLNWWHWEGESLEEQESMARDFKSKIDKIKDCKIDIAFFPVDPRLEAAYSYGGEYFIRELAPKYFIPMHFWDKYSIIDDFIHKVQAYNTEVVDINKRNQEIFL